MSQDEETVEEQINRQDAIEAKMRQETTLLLKCTKWLLGFTISLTVLTIIHIVLTLLALHK